MPTPRCWFRVGNSAVDVCANLAGWVRPGVGELPGGFFCDRHRAHFDKPIAAGFIARRVSLRVDVLFAGTALVPRDAHVEAVERLTRAVEAAGGLLNLHDVTSELGRYTPPAAPGGPKPPRGGR